MHRWLWVLQILLAIVFLAHGLIMLFPPESIVEQMNASLPRWFQVFLGVAEVAAAVGLTLPGLTGVLPAALVPAAAVGIMIVMVSATVFHLMRAEWSSAVVTFVLLLMASYVAYVRWSVAPIQSRRSVTRA